MLEVGGCVNKPVLALIIALIIEESCY